jgi:hypothetical protein
MLARCGGQLLIYLALLVLKRSVVLAGRIEFTTALAGSGTDRASMRGAMTLSHRNHKVVYILLFVDFRLLTFISRRWEGDSW